MARNSSIICPHLDEIPPISLVDLCKLKQGMPCSECDITGPNLWICLSKNCLHTGCSEQFNDHSTKHFQNDKTHCIHMNLSSQRIWCYMCEIEVFLPQNRRSSINTNDKSKVIKHDQGGGESCESSADDDDMERNYYCGLVGLQNIANTCYMNAALQALSNSPPLTEYFLECGDLIEASSELGNANQKKPGLARSYYRLIKEMWGKPKSLKSFIVPSGILYGIRNVHPMFRGYQQHDTQEFLRCFMDQLHEELKEVIPPPPDKLFDDDENEEDRSQCSTPSPSPSEGEYETCDSGVSEQSSLSDENEEKKLMANRNNRHMDRRSPSPVHNQRTNKSGYQQSGSPNSPNSPGSPKSSGSSAATKPPHRSIISDVFDGKLLSSVQCLTCDRVSTREETFQDLSLPIPGKDHLAVLHQSQSVTSLVLPCNVQPMNVSGSAVTCSDAVYQAAQDGWFWWIWNWVRSWFWGPAVSLHDCMAAFFSADELKGDNMYSCEKCNKLRNGIKYSRVLALPEMLCIHLKRFRHDLSYSSKISSPVIFPLTGLDMRPYLHKDCRSEISTYDLTSVICHHGTVGGGHYTSYAKHEPTGKWFEFDDHLVSEVSAEQVQNCEAYVLFYRKVNPQMDEIREHVVKLSMLEQPQMADIKFFVSRQWLNRFYTFAEPGPIDNWALLCPHGGLSPSKVAIAPRLVMPLHQSIWDYLYKKFGGGPACNHLFECDTCRTAAQSLAARQQEELETFKTLNDEFQYRSYSHTAIYAISMSWMRQWQLFARGITSEEPGPINNASIALNTESSPIRGVRPGSDYAHINTYLWRFFHEIYGGGPEIILSGTPPEPTEKPMSSNQRHSGDYEQESSRIYPDETNQFVEESTDKTMESSSDDDASDIIAPSQIKPEKAVSFEDEILNDNKEESDNGIEHTQSQSLNNGHPKGNRKNPNIVSKRDKRNRDTMKNVGLFGVEGKYKTNDTNTMSNTTQQNNSTAKNESLFQNKDTQREKTILKNSGSREQNSYQNVEEITPLLHQATINSPDMNSSSAIMINDGHSPVPSPPNSKQMANHQQPRIKAAYRNTNHQHSSRKRLRTKSQRNANSQNLINMESENEIN